MHYWSILGAAAISAPALAAPPKPVVSISPSGAKSFVDGIYREYERAGKPPADGRVFSVELANLIKKDGDIATKQGEPNLIDYVLLCGCQDNEGLRFSTSVTSSTVTSSTVRVTATYKGKPSKIPPFELRLSKTALGWRISDIISRGEFGGSLLVRLRKGLGVIAASSPAQGMGGHISPQPVAALPALPPAIRYQGYTGSDRFPVYNDLRLTRSGEAITGTFFMQIGIFSGDAPITGSFANGECSVTRKKETYRGLCNEREFAGTIYDSKGKPGKPFRFISQAEVQRQSGSTGNVPTASTPSAAPPIVWSLGRARILVERGQRCAADVSMGTPYCFGQAIEWLQRHSDKQAIDVVAMENSWALGSMVPHNSGQGWDIYRVAKNGTGFEAKKQRHYGTQVRLPQGCMYSGVADQAWFISVARGRKTAVEAARYVCEGWNGSPVYTRYLDAGDIDAGQGDLALTLVRR